MITRNDSKRLAEAALSGGALDAVVASYVLRNLSRSEIAQFLLFFEKMLAERSVVVTSREPLDAATRARIEQKFAGRLVFFGEYAGLGEGLVVSMGDSVIDLSVKGYVAKALRELGRE
jgi:F0F1-type ATP synthase delta subunit